jgi:hypothetical protein
MGIERDNTLDGVSTRWRKDWFLQSLTACLLYAMFLCVVVWQFPGLVVFFQSGAN